MSRFEKLAHVIWHCLYHIAGVPKRRFLVLKGPVARETFNCIQVYSSRFKPTFQEGWLSSSLNREHKAIPGSSSSEF